MTVSEPAGGAGPAGGVQTLLAGHLHPAVLLLRLLDGLRQALIPLLLGIAVDRLFLALGGFLFVLHLAHGVVRYLTYSYTLTEAELVTREGILHRQERRIPIDRVQDLAFEATLLRRFLGIAVVLVETASGKGAEAVLDSLGRAEAEQLREVLLRARAARGSAAGAGPEAAAVPAEPEWTVFRARTGDLLLRGLTDLRLGAIVVTAFAALELADQLGLVMRLKGAADSFFDWLRAFPAALAAAFLVLLVVVVLGVGVALSALGNLVVFHGFVLTLRGDSLLRRYGLLTTRQKTLPRARVQRVTIEQTWIRRLLGFAVVHADSAGSGRGQGQPSASGFDVVVPLAELGRALWLLPALLPELGALPGAWRLPPKLLVLRVFLKGAIAVAVLLALALPVVGAAGWLALLLLPAAALVGRLCWGNLAWALDERHLFMRWGVLGRYHAIVPTGRIQAVVALGSPLQRILGLCDLTVFVAGGSPTRLPDLTRTTALALQQELAARAARAAAGDWRPRSRV
jgi:putative membrane protein